MDGRSREMEKMEDEGEVALERLVLFYFLKRISKNWRWKPPDESQILFTAGMLEGLQCNVHTRTEDNSIDLT